MCCLEIKVHLHAKIMLDSYLHSTQIYINIWFRLNLASDFYRAFWKSSTCQAHGSQFQRGELTAQNGTGHYRDAYLLWSQLLSWSTGDLKTYSNGWSRSPMPHQTRVKNTKNLKSMWLASVIHRHATSILNGSNICPLCTYWNFLAIPLSTVWSP